MKWDSVKIPQNLEVNKNTKIHLMTKGLMEVGLEKRHIVSSGRGTLPCYLFLW